MVVLEVMGEGLAKLHVNFVGRTPRKGSTKVLVRTSRQGFYAGGKLRMSGGAGGHKFVFS